MTKRDLVAEVRGIIARCSEAEKRILLGYLRQCATPHPLEQKWGVSADTILSAIARSSDLTLRGIRGIIAEASFEEFVIPTLSEWRLVAVPLDSPYDFLLEHRATPTQVRVQVKLQRMEKQAPKRASRKLRESLRFVGEILYVVEVQKTRTGQIRGEHTRPYRFGDFDVLAVNMHPSTGDWRRFLYTVANWLLPRSREMTLMEIMQPVPGCADDCWTDDLGECLRWFLGGPAKRLYH